MKILLLLLFFIPLNPFSQQNMDSLFGIWNDLSQPDTVRLQTMKLIAWNGYLRTDPDSAFYFAQLQYDLAEEKGIKKHMAVALIIQGTSLKNKGNFSEAIIYQKRSFAIYAELGDAIGMSATLNNMGNIYIRIANFDKAIECQLKSLKLAERAEDERSIGITLNNIGNIYNQQDDSDKALEYYERSLDSQKRYQNDKIKGTTLANIANILQKKGELKSALDYLQQSLIIRENQGDIRSIGMCYLQFGSLYLKTDEFDTAREYYLSALELFESYGDISLSANALNGVSKTYLVEGKYPEAAKYSNRALQLGQELGDLKRIKSSSTNLWQSYRKMGQYKKALDMYELHIETLDTLEEIENKGEVLRQTYEYEYEKKALADSLVALEKNKLKDAELLVQRAENKRQKQQSYYLYGVLVLALLFGGVVYNRFRVTRKQNDIIAEQKSEVEAQKLSVENAHIALEQKNQEIVDSINYAKRIQTAILPELGLLENTLLDCFILYKPKDIVAGDFYWMDKVNDTFLIAAADCTGHGVPGAMVSVVCTNGLNSAVRQYGLTEPCAILDKTREIVVGQFAKSGEKVKDGMDIALCSIKNKTLKFSGANNPLWIVRKAEYVSVEEQEGKGNMVGEGHVLIETKGDKQPIGHSDHQKPFNQTEKELKKGDIVYLLTDGFADQFGGINDGITNPAGKKFKYSRLKKLILTNSQEPLDAQRNHLDKAFEAWQGGLEQLDDVCIIGFKVS